MTLDQIIVTVVGVAGIALVYWFFLMKKTDAVSVTDSVDITVSGGYSPEVITVQKGKPITINFLRTDSNNCLEEVILSDFKIRKHLPLNQKVSVTITPQVEGEFDYACGMNMYHGKIIVKNAV
jgi:plastocyanin domain-containing protein